MGFHFGQKGQLSWSLSPYSFHLPSNMGKGVGVEGLSKTEVSTKWYSGNVLQERDTVSLLTVPWEYWDSWGCRNAQCWYGVRGWSDWHKLTFSQLYTLLLQRAHNSFFFLILS
jgi:hypothetical protein